MASEHSFGSIKKISTQTAPAIKEKFTWAIKNFRSHTDTVGKYKESPRFRTDQGCEWSVDIFLNGYDENTSDYVGIRAYLFNDSIHVNKNFAFKCSLLDKDGKECLTQLVTVIKVTGDIRNLVLKKNLLAKSEWLPDGELRLAFEILYFSDGLSETCEEAEVQHSQNMQLDICKALYATRKFSDFKLIVQGKEFCVHRAILSAQSPVFEAMFESNMRESSKGEAHVDDIEAEVIDKLLRFIYTGNTDFGNLIEKVLIAADKYQLDLLKSRCEGIIAKGLTDGNIYDILLLADRVNAIHLKTKAMDFFDENKEKLVTAEDFKTLIGSLPKELLIDIISANALKHMKKF